jgi:shikimate dehydrogenase
MQPCRNKSKYRGIPLLPYEHFTAHHIAFDLIYNPAETQFLKKAKDEGAQIKTATICLFFKQKSMENLE